MRNTHILDEVRSPDYAISVALLPLGAVRVVVAIFVVSELILSVMLSGMRSGRDLVVGGHAGHWEGWLGSIGLDSWDSSHSWSSVDSRASGVHGNGGSGGVGGPEDWRVVVGGGGAVGSVGVVGVGKADSVERLGGSKAQKRSHGNKLLHDGLGFFRCAAKRCERKSGPH